MDRYSGGTHWPQAFPVHVRVPIQCPAHGLPPEKGSTGPAQRCFWASPGSQVQTGLCPTPLRPVGPLRLAPEVAINAERNPTRLSTVTVPPSRPSPCRVRTKSTHPLHNTTQRNLSYPGPTSFKRLHLLAFTYSQTTITVPHAPSDLVLFSPFPKFPDHQSPPFSSRLHTSRPSFGQPLPTLGIRLPGSTRLVC